VIIYGVNPVREALRSDRIPVRRVFLSLKQAPFPIRGLPVERTDRARLGRLAGSSAHQGIAAEIDDFPYSDEREWVTREGPMNLVLLDRVNDPHNLGAAIRVCEGAGVDGVIIGEKFGTGVTPAVFKVSAGAAAHLPVIRTGSLPHLVHELKASGVTIFAVENGRDALTPDALRARLAERNLFIFGSEGEGISRALLDKADATCSIPMRGRINSLNLSTSVAALLFSVL